VSLLQQILDGSLVSRQRLMQARQFYSPQSSVPTPERAFARWTERVALQTELGSAREIAGLSDAELSALQSEFERSPIRSRSDRFRSAFLVGAVLAGAGGFLLALQALTVGFGDGGYRVLEVLSVACVLAGVCVLVAGAYAGFSTLHLDMSHGTVGLYVGRLDEQHPWLYDSMALARNPSAEAYRCQVLRDRGALRGADFVVMREIVRAQESLERTQWARTVAEHVQRQVPAADAASSEPRLVRVGSRHDQRTGSATRRVDAQG
jgi:hypothetical protein